MTLSHSITLFYKQKVASISKMQQMQWNLYLVHQLIEKYNNVQSVVLVSFQQMQHIIRIYKHYQIIQINFNSPESRTERHFILGADKRG